MESRREEGEGDEGELTQLRRSCQKEGKEGERGEGRDKSSGLTAANSRNTENKSLGGPSMTHRAGIFLGGGDAQKSHERPRGLLTSKNAGSKSSE